VGERAGQRENTKNKNKREPPFNLVLEHVSALISAPEFISTTYRVRPF